MNEKIIYPDTCTNCVIIGGDNAHLTLVKYKEWFDYLKQINYKVIFDNTYYGIDFFDDKGKMTHYLGMTDFCDHIELELGKPSKIWKK